jgi:uncharacterized protein
MQSTPIKFFSSKVSLPTPQSAIFAITLDSGACVYYSVYNNALYEDAACTNLISPNPVNTNLDFDMVGTRQKRNDPYWLRIQLGHECNYSCSYCLQKDLGFLSKPTKNKPAFNPEAFAGLSTANLSRIDLWGGEPLLYWDTICQIIEHYDRPGLEFFISTNGSLLKAHHAEYFAARQSKICLGISHDGPMQTTLRGKEWLHRDPGVLKSLTEQGISWSFNPTISTQNPDISAVHDFFVDWATRNNLSVPFINFGLQHDHSPISDGSSLHEHLQRFLARTDTVPNSLHNGDQGVEGFIKSLAFPNVAARVTSCGVDDSQVLSVDLKGNLIVCPHTGTKYGTTQQFAPIVEIDLNRYDRHCNSCHVWRLCKSTCPIESNQFEANCASSYDWYSTIFRVSVETLTGHKVINVTRYQAD